MLVLRVKERVSCPFHTPRTRDLERPESAVASVGLSLCCIRSGKIM